MPVETLIKLYPSLLMKSRAKAILMIRWVCLSALAAALRAILPLSCLVTNPFLILLAQYHLFCGKDERGKGEDDDDDGAMMTAVPMPKCQPPQSRVSVYPQPAAAGAAGGAQIKTQSFEQHASMPSNSLQISTPTSESNSLISALAFDRPPSASAPWGNHIGFASSPTMALPMNSGWFALAQVPVPTPVVSGNIVKSEPEQQGQAASDLPRNEDRGGNTGEKAAKRPKIDIPEEGFHQVVTDLFSRLLVQQYL